LSKKHKLISKLWKISFFLSVLTGAARAVSKATLDFAVIVANKLLFHYQSTNDKAGIEGFIKCLKSHCPEAGFSNSIYCMEHTGIYNNHIIKFLHLKKAKIWLEHPIHIKDSLGMIRGKNDRGGGPQG
jgi:transposase